jgi:hypothetical protein
MINSNSSEISISMTQRIKEMLEEKSQATFKFI